MTTSTSCIETRTRHREPCIAAGVNTEFSGAYPQLNDQRRTQSQSSACKTIRDETKHSDQHDHVRCNELLSPAEQRDLAVRSRSGDSVARETLIVANLRLVTRIARRYYSYGATLDDLIQEGRRGLIDAVERYDPQRHTARFSTYAAYWIRNKIQRAVAANYSLIRLPEYMFRLNLRSHKDIGKRQDEEGLRNGKESTLGARLGISPRRLQLLNKSVISRSSYYEINDIGENTDLAEATTHGSLPERAPETAETLDELYKAIDQLTPLEAWLLRHHFGLADSRNESPAEASVGVETTTNAAADSGPWPYARIGRELGISVHRVRNIERGALEKLRRIFRGSGFSWI